MFVRQGREFESNHVLTRKQPQTLRSPLSLIAAEMVSPAATRTARKSSSTSDFRGWGSAVRVSMSMNSPSFSGSGTLAVIRPNAASSLTPQDQTLQASCQPRSEKFNKRMHLQRLSHL